MGVHPACAPFEKTKRKRVIRKYVHQKGAVADPVETVLVIFLLHFLAVIRIFKM